MARFLKADEKHSSVRKGSFMKWKIIIALLLTSLAGKAYAQDIIHTVDAKQNVFDDWGTYGPIDYRWGHYYDCRGRLRPEDMADYIGISLYGSDYMKAKSQYMWGMSLTTTGATLLVGALVGGLMTADYNRKSASMSSGMSWHGPGHGDYSAGSTLPVVGGLAGAVCLGAGIPIWIKGNRGLNRIADDYNRNYGRDRLGHAPSLSVGATGSGIGLALNF